MILWFWPRLVTGLLLAACLNIGLLANPLPAQELSALAKLDPAASALADQDGGISLQLQLSQPVPWRVRLMDSPPRLVLDVREVDWSGVDRIAGHSTAVKALRAGVFRPGWSRLVMELSGPMRVAQAGMATTQGARLSLRLAPTDPDSFHREASRPEPPEWAPPRNPDLPPPVVKKGGPLIVVLDPGHGGIDPGAERDGKKEADIVLSFARELKEALLRDGNFQVVMTRDADVFVPLETRISIARAAGGQVFIALHADALAEGEAVGATVYTLAADASDEASATLAERHDRDDLLAGVDLSRADDLVATVLMDMARTETMPRTQRLAAALVDAIKGEGLRMHRHPLQQASFSVLKSPDIPSVLLELGFLSSARDLDRLQDPQWRSSMAKAVTTALRGWAKNEAALSTLTGPQTAP